ncbi:MAG: hypothetical protein Q4G43_14195 [Mobilicoccus sp.]|nr:hypothetical protein [Mobilicoccus sp.]
MNDTSPTSPTQPRDGHDTTPLPDAAQARRQLDEAGSRHLTSERDLRVLQLVTAGVGALMAAVLVLVYVVEDRIGLLIGMGVYAAGLLALIAWNRTVRAVPRGFARRYSAGIVGTSVLYAIGILLITTTTLTWPLVIALVVITAAPALLAAWSIGRMARR